MKTFKKIIIAIICLYAIKLGSDQVQTHARWMTENAAEHFAIDQNAPYIDFNMGAIFLYCLGIFVIAYFMVWYLTKSNKPKSILDSQEKKYTKEQMENAIAFGRNLGISYPEMNEEQANLRREEIKKFIEKDFHY